MNELMLRRRMMMVMVKKESNPYPELQMNKAWDADNGGEHQPAPIDKTGYVVTPFYSLTRANNRWSVTIKCGFTSATYNKACFVFKTNLTDAKTKTAYIVGTSDPKTITPTNNAYKLFSATLKASELDDCYVYDNNAQVYLFKGRNVT